MTSPTQGEDGLLAAEYVLGTLVGSDKRKFEKRLRTSPEAAAAVRYWESRLAPLALALRPVPADPEVWRTLQRRIAEQKVVSMPRPASPLLMAWASMATAASLALAALLFLQPDAPGREPIVQVRVVEKPVVQTAYVAYLKMADADMHWMVSAVPDSGALRVVAGGTPPASAAGNDPELWWLGPNGPVSMGVIPVSGELTANIPLRVGAFAGKQLAVSLEPAGGSPSGQPTGPVIAVASVLRAI